MTVNHLDPGLVALTRHATAQALSLSEATIDRLIKDGVLRAVKIGRSVRIPVEDVKRVATEGVRRNDR